MVNLLTLLTDLVLRLLVEVLHNLLEAVLVFLPQDVHFLIGCKSSLRQRHLQWNGWLIIDDEPFVAKRNPLGLVVRYAAGPANRTPQSIRPSSTINWIQCQKAVPDDICISIYPTVARASMTSPAHHQRRCVGQLDVGFGRAIRGAEHNGLTQERAQSPVALSFRLSARLRRWVLDHGRVLQI